MNRRAFLASLIAVPVAAVMPAPQPFVLGSVAIVNRNLAGTFTNLRVRTAPSIAGLQTRDFTVYVNGYPIGQTITISG